MSEGGATDDVLRMSDELRAYLRNIVEHDPGDEIEDELDAQMERQWYAMSDSDREVARNVSAALNGYSVGWPRVIPVSERLPSVGPDENDGCQEFMVYGKRTRDSVPMWGPAVFDGVNWWCRITDYPLRYVTHWLPLAGHLREPTLESDESEERRS